MLKYVFCSLLLLSCGNLKKKSQKIEASIAKKKGHCSPLDKLQGKEHCIDEKLEAKKSNIRSKLGKKAGYCSPLDRVQNKKHCQ